MFKYLRYLCLLCVILSLAHAANPVVIQLVTHDLPPYSFINKKGQADGLAMQRVSCVLQLLKLPHKIPTMHVWCLSFILPLLSIFFFLSFIYIYI